MGFLWFILFIIFLILWSRVKKANKKLETELNEKNTNLENAKTDISNITDKLNKSESRVAALSKYEGILDAEKEASRITEAAKAATDVDRAAAKELVEKAKNSLKDAHDEADRRLTNADTEAKRIIDSANAKAEEIAGNSYKAMQNAEEYSKTAKAMKNIIDGYGDQYLKPTYSLLDELADDFSYTDAGKNLKDARDNSERMIKNGTAAKCDYVEDYRKNTAIAFVTDAFNGKVDSILSKTKKDNYGTLEQKIKDAYQVVNYNGKAFKNAEITPAYLDSRLQELKWACTVSELKFQAQEEQRRIREQMREEEKARREYERAQKEAAKEAEMLHKAMEKAQAMVQNATAEKKAEYEAKLSGLQKQLEEAEARGQRALSMAQQTRHGNVYVISNIGSFGENVYKVGMTRRLEPLDRVRELGDASVPFPFDVHAIIESDDAPTLEYNLHQQLAIMQMNKVNPRKEFFKVPLTNIKSLVDKTGLHATWTMAAEAAEYKETLAIEKNMATDPQAKAKWEAYASSIKEDNSEDIEDAE